MSAETYKDFYREMKNSLLASYDILKENGENNATLAQIRQAIENLETRPEEDIKEYEKEVVLPFELLGIDQIFVDEADKFKNLKIPTAMKNISGLQTGDSQRSLDLYVKTKWLSKMHGGGVVFATGTPVSNSFSEIFTMTRYLANDRLQEIGIEFFDAWAQAFVKGIPRMELSTSGKGFDAVIRLRLTNLGSLITAYREFADIKMPEDLPYLKRPNLKNNTRTIVEIPMSEAYEKFLEDVQDRATAIHNGGVDPAEDNFLNITNDLRKASLDMRLIDPKLSDAQAGAKINALCDAATAKTTSTTRHLPPTRLLFMRESSKV